MPVLLGLFRSLLVEAADRGPGVGSQRRREALEAEPGAGLGCSGRADGNLEGHAFAENVDGQLEILRGGRAERERLLRLRGAQGIGEARERQVPCPFHEQGEIAEEFAMRAKSKRLLDGALGEKVRGVVRRNGYAVIGKLRRVELINFSGGAAASGAR